MHYTQRPYHGEADLPAVLALKQLCTTPEILYDRPTTGELRQLLAPLAEPTTRTIEEKPSRAEALRGMLQEQRHRALTRADRKSRPPLPTRLSKVLELVNSLPSVHTVALTRSPPDGAARIPVEPPGRGEVERIVDEIVDECERVKKVEAFGEVMYGD